MNPTATPKKELVYANGFKPLGAMDIESEYGTLFGNTVAQLTTEELEAYVAAFDRDDEETADAILAKAKERYRQEHR